MGAGGFLSDIKIYSDGTKLIRTDTYNGYASVATGTCTFGGGSFPAPCWQPLFTASSLPSSLANLNTSGLGNMGLAEVVACNSNTNVMYAYLNNVLMVTVDRGAHWVATSQTTSQNANSGPKPEGPYLACDPNNVDILYAGEATKMVVTLNGTAGASGGTSTATFATVTGVGTTGSIPSFPMFDPSSPVTGGISQHLWICTQGTGVYESTNGGADGGTFTLTSGGPTTFARCYGDKFHQLWTVDGNTTASNYLNGTGWTSHTVPGANGLNGITTDPNSTSISTNKVVGIIQAGNLTISTNNGGTFSDPFFPESNTYTSSAPQPAWIGASWQQGFLDSPNLVIDSSSNVWATGGISIWNVANPAADTALTYTANAVGIEQLVTNLILSPPGGFPFAAVWDRGIIPMRNPDVFPATQYPNGIQQIGNGVIAAWGADYGRTSSPSTVIGCFSDQFGGNASAAVSRDGGNSFATMANFPATLGLGCVMAASTDTNWVMISSQSNQTISYTANGGTSAWGTATVPGSPQFLNSVDNNRQPLVADMVTAGTFYAIDENQDVYRSTNNGVTWSEILVGPCCDGSTYRDVLVAVPNNAGHLFYTVGGGANGITHPANTHLWKSVNGGLAWADVNVNLKEVNSVGFGPPQPGNTGCGGSGCPSIYVVGWLSGVQCICASFDEGATWQLITASPLSVPSSQGTWPMNSIDLVTSTTGDLNVYGRINVGFVGSGAGYIDTQDARPWVGWSNTLPNASLTGTVSLQAQHSGPVPVTAVDFYVDGTLIGRQTTGSGNPTTYTQNWVTGGVANGSHTLKVLAEGSTNSLCNTSLVKGNSFSIPITTH